MSITSDGHDGAAVTRPEPENTTTSDDSSYISGCCCSTRATLIRLSHIMGGGHSEIEITDSSDEPLNVEIISLVSGGTMRRAHPIVAARP